MIVPDDMKMMFRNGEYYERNVVYHINRLIQKDMVFYDIGANFGYYSCLVATKCKQVYSFEPVKSTYDILINNTKEYDNVNCFNFGLFSEDRKSNIHIYQTSGCNSIFKRNADGILHLMNIQDIDLYTLDNTVCKYNLLPPDLIKIDVEGVEKYILQGAPKTLSSIPIIICEYSVNTASDSGYDVTDLIDILYSYGYKDIKGIKGDNDVYLYDIEDFDNTITNIVAV